MKTADSSAKLINKSDICKAVRLENPLGNLVASAAMKILGFDYINGIYPEFSMYEGKEFTTAAMKSFDIRSDINEEELKNIPAEGPFITVSNHPFGGWDGILLYDTIAAIRPEFKIIVNFILAAIPNLKDSFLTVNPFSERKELKSSLPGLRAAFEILQKGGALGIFPAGEVSTYNGEGKTICDKEWRLSMLKLIQKSGVPVIPVYFDGTNSRMFHRLGKIDPVLRTIDLPKELIKKKGSTVAMRIGRPIPAAEIARFTDLKELGRYLKSRTYALEANTRINVPALPVPQKQQPIAERQQPAVLAAEIEKIRKEDFLFSVSRYECFLADFKDIPHLMEEIGRAREISFREVGEGTGKSTDTDPYDSYYRHLILWDKESTAIVGAYRLGIGKEIMEKYGYKGFYTSTLFNFSETFTERLSQTIELGRSFLATEYKKEALPLMLLIKGLLYTVTRYPDCRYLFGPASITSWFPPFYRSLIIYALSATSKKENRGLVSPKCPFRYEFLRTDPEALLKGKYENIDFFDKYIQKLSNGKFRVPTLIKKYRKLNADILAFNVDKDFNYCVDGMILLDLDDVPKAEVKALTKGSEHPEELLQRFAGNRY